MKRKKHKKKRNEESVMSIEEGSAKRPIEDPLEERVALINGHFHLQSTTIKGISEICLAVIECSVKLESVFKRHKVDMEQAITTFDLLQRTKHMASEAFFLPLVKRN